MRITAAQLAAVMSGNAQTQAWVEPLNAAMREFGIGANAHRIAAFLGQIAVESGELRRMEENLHYTAKRLCAVWPKRFPTLADAQPYAGNPEALANRVYADRIGNGNTASGDGWRYRGRGLMQVTGRGNYASVGKALGLNLIRSPDLLLQPEIAARSAGQFWFSHGCNELADDRSGDDDDEDFVAITAKINPAREGLAARRSYWLKARQTLGI